MTKAEFWSLFKRFVMYHPADTANPCHRLDTWAVLKSFETDLSDPALGMTILDRAKSHYFSRQWALSKYNPNAIRHRYPLLAANIVEVAAERKGTAERVDRLVFDLFVLDVVKAPKGAATECHRRTEIQIYEDCHNRLQEVFGYLATSVVASITPAVGPDESFSGSEQELIYLLGAGSILAYVIDETASRSLQRRMKTLTAKTKSFPWRGGTNGLYGCYAPELVMEFPVCETAVILEFPDEYTGAISEMESY